MSEPGSKCPAWNEHTRYALGFHRLIGRSLGIWPLTCGDVSSKIQFIFVVVMQLVMNYNLIREFTSGCVSLSNAVDFVGVLGTTTSSLLKIFVIRAHQREMRCVVESAVRDWSVFRDDKSRDTMRGHAYVGRVVSIFQLGTAYASAVVILIIAPPTIGGASTNHFSSNFTAATPLRNMPMASGCSVADMPNYLYLSFYCFQFLQLLNLCNCIMGSDALFFAISMHLCAQLELLARRISRLGRNDERGKVRENFAAVIRRHNHLSLHMNFVENTFSLMILGQLASSALHISLLGIKILFGLRDSDYITIAYSLISATNLLRQIYIYSYAGDYLASQARKIREAAYSCSWYNFSPSLTRDVMFVMVRSNKPFCLTAGQMYPMNIASFTTLLKTLLSFFSVLKLTMVD